MKNLQLIILGLFFSSLSFSQVNLDSMLVAYYPCNGNAFDESGNGNNGTVYGATLTTDRFGNENGAYLFDGVNDYIDCGNSSSLSINKSLTVCAWVKSSNYYGVTASKWKTESGWQGSWSFGLNHFHLIHNGWDGYPMYSNDSINPNEFNLIVGIYDYDSNLMKYYVNGKLSNQIVGLGGSIYISNARLLLGAQRWYANGYHESYLNGIIDEVRIYSRALSPEEVDSLYNNTVFDKQTILIPAGWSGISSYITPNDADIENLFSPVIDDLVILQNHDGVYWPFAGVNTLGNWDSQAGYRIKMASAQTVTFIGWMQDNLTVNLDAGWNYLPVLNFCDNPADELFSAIDGNLQIVKEIGGSGVYWPAYGVNTLAVVEPGKAYMMKVDDEANLEFPDCAPIPAFPLEGEGEGTRMKSSTSTQDPNSGLCVGTPLSSRRGVGGEVIKTASTHTIAIPENALHEVQPGNIICAFDAAGNCFGASAFSTASSAITLFGDDPTTPEKDGFIEGEPIYFKLYSPETQEESVLAIEFDISLPDCNGKFKVNGLSAFKSIVAGATAINVQEMNDVNIYPNPAIDIVNVDLGFQANATLKILSVHGQELFTKQLAGQNNTVDISTLPVGLYFVQIESEHKRICHKLVKE